MRREGALIVAIGLTVTGAGAWVAARQPAPPGPGQPGRVTAAVTSRVAGGKTGGSGMKVVRYGGYTLDVPAAWPVYQLSQDPSRCVRYDRHAVYLGTPGPDQQCPAHLVGRVATITLQPAGGAAAGTPAAGIPAAGTPAAGIPPAGTPAAGPRWHAPGAWLRLGTGLTRGGGTVRQNAADHELLAVLHGPGLSVTATYGGDGALLSGVLRTLRRVGGTAGTGAPAAAPAAAGLTPAAPATLTSRSATAGPARTAQPVSGTQAGFDTCAAPPLSVLQKWRSAYSAVGIYLGGPEAACDQRNLSAAYVRSATQMGWSLIPTYVGVQAPCSRFRQRIRVGHARVDGEAAAADAVALAKAVGIGRGAPIYDDMEAYDSGKGVCRRQVLSFLNGWTRGLRARGYISGVYSSAGSGIHDLGATSRIYGQWLAKPRAIWYGLWDGRANLWGAPYLDRPWWSGHRIKQYAGGHLVTIGGATLDIDSDLVDGSVYR